MERAGRNQTMPNHSPLMFDSDEDLAEDENNINTENSEKAEDTPATPVITREERLVSQIRLVMTGVPPPPSCTTPKLDVLQILKLWSDNQHLVNNIEHLSETTKDSVVHSVEDAKNTVWPSILQIETFGIHYNKSKASEDFEQLCCKYRERYVGNETASWIGSLLTQSPGKTASAKKRARYRSWGHSPGRRLSHLARRRQVFTSANLQSLGANSAKQRERKTILMDTKKPACQQKKSRNSSVKKKQVVKNNTSTSNNPKRALFQSPDDKPAMKLPITNVKQSPNTLKIQRSKRALWPSDNTEKREFNSNGKRVRSSVTPSPRKKCNRNLFCDSSTNSKTNAQETAKKSMLSNPHQKKLLWAISQALREEGIRMNHKNFQSCLSVLNGPCLALWLWKTAKHPPRGSTSENMLAMVKEIGVKTIIEDVKDNSSPSHLMSLRLNLVKKVERIKSVTSEKPSDKADNSEVNKDKENIATDKFVTESSHVVGKNTPLKDNNLLCETKVKENCAVRSSVKTDLKLNNSDNKPDLSTNSADIDTNLFSGNFNKSNVNNGNTDLIRVSSSSSELKENLLSDNNETTNLFKNVDECDNALDTPFKGFNIDSSIVPVNKSLSNPLSISDLLSWNADPILRLQNNASELDLVSKQDQSVSNNWQAQSVNTMLDINRQAYSANTDDDNSTIEFVVHDDETRSSSIYSFDLNSFVDDSRTCFDFPNIQNVPCASVGGFEET